MINLNGLEMDPDVFPIIEEFAMKLHEKLDHRPSPLYRLMTWSPISYKIVPEIIRNKLMRTKMKTREVSLYGKTDLEETRKKFLENLGFNETNANRNICFLTHDIDSEKGLRKALRLKMIEEKYDIESTWFIPMEEYKLDKKIVRRLAENGEIASHGTKHDGKLLSLGEGKLVKELRKSKEKFEEITEKEIHGFRTPLLQYNGKLLEAIGESEFKYDSSVPAWEPMHPFTMKPDGIELINPITINGLLEIPVTLPQDHQMLHILGLTPKQIVKLWTTMIEYIYKMGGISVILVHPDYEFASEENIEHYKEIISALEDKEVIKLKQLFLDMK
jgi:peptidoglycan/xylan/chitin deacetylase (PgdA/CDA1 family)